MKVSFSQRIFELIKSEPHLTDAEVHIRLSLDPKYKIASGKSLLYRMVCVKYVHRDKNGRLTAMISNYVPLPPYQPRPKKKAKAKVAATGLAAAAKAKQMDYLNQAVKYRESAMMNSYTPPHSPLYKNVPIHIGVEPKKSFWRKLRELFSD